MTKILSEIVENFRHERAIDLCSRHRPSLSVLPLCCLFPPCQSNSRFHTATANDSALCLHVHACLHPPPHSTANCQLLRCHLPPVSSYLRNRPALGLCTNNKTTTNEQRTDEPMNQRTNQPTNQQTNKPTNQPTNHPTNDQRANEPTSQRTNEPTNQRPTTNDQRRRGDTTTQRDAE